MGRSTLIALGAGVLAAVAVLSHSCSNTNEIVIDQVDGGPVCNLGSLSCASGFACTNSVCMPTCPTGVCPSGLYCEGDAGIDQVCAPVGVTLCVDFSQCPAPQTCFGGLCTSPELLADGGRGNCVNTPPNDGCSRDALCFQTTSGSTFTCVGMPACGQGGGCPPGSTCNVQSDGGRFLDGKQRICLLGLCAASTDCPTGAPHCVKAGDGGIENTGCFPGTVNSPCVLNTDCNPGLNCVIADGGFSGACR